YVDEINLLPDALSDLLLDSAASGIHRQERDGLSQVLHSRYILIGTMNPEEGDLRPQLSDRFAHGVRIEDSFSALERVEIGRRRLAFDDDPAAFENEWAPATECLNTRLQEARQRLLSVQVPDALRLALAERAQKAGLEGMRAELAVLRTARAAAAFRGATAAAAEDLEEAWDLCLGHRSTEPPLGLPPPAARPPQSEKPPQTSNPGTSSSLAGAPPSSSPLTPKDAQPDPIPLLPMQKPRILSLPQPLFPNRHLTAPMAATARLATSRLESGPVLWQASVVASLKRGWEPGAAGWTWVRSSARPVRRLWALLDASRSTGGASFLEQAREVLAGVLRSVKKVSLLLIHNNCATWLLRSGAPGRALAGLSHLPSAAGGSPIAGALGKLNRAVSGGRATPRDTVCICSDGMPTLRSGQSAAQAARAIRAALQRLARSSSSSPFWLRPPMGRGVAAWLEKLLKGSGCELVQLPLKSLKTCC
ncbi:MAG: Mg-chelatase subunit ChlI, partial [Verrucomicrobia bacterium]